MATDIQPLLAGLSRNPPIANVDAEDRVRDAAKASLKSGETAADGEEKENPDRPKGVRLAIVFGCILMGDFLTGYVRAAPRDRYMEQS